MDFSAFDSRTAAEIPREMQVRAQQTGEPIASDAGPCIVLVKGAASRSLQSALKAEVAAQVAAAKAAKKKGEDDDDRSMAGIHDGLVKAAARLITGFRNIQRKGADGKLRDLTGSEEDVAWFLDLNMISTEHLLRHGAVVKANGEDDADFAARRDAYVNAWHRPSFAQQVLDFAQDDANFLAKPATA
jgi:hypothetical protein